MAKYKDKWKTTFPAAIGNQTRPEDGVDNTQEYNTDGLPQYMANDPVRYDLQNAINSQLVSNDERLNEKIKHTSDDLAAHNKDPKAHATGISGNAATATKLQTPRTLALTGKAAGSTTFDGSDNAAINVTSVNADTASKATQDGAGNVITNTYLKKAGDTATGDLTAPNFKGHLAGNADSATKITNNGNRNNLANGTKAPSGLSVYQCYTHSGYPQQYGNVISIGGTGDNELFLGWQNDARLYYRDKVDVSNDWTSWKPLAFISDINYYAPTKTGGGASGTWGINISGNAAGLSGDLVFPEIGNTNVSRKITWNGSTDGADIYYQTTESDQGNLVLNLRDDTNCYLRIAANGAFKSYFSPDGVFHGNVDNADTVDGYHAQDILDNITAANVGGIIASALDANGYVKFASGLLIVWGNGSAGNNDDTNGWLSATLPIKMSKIFVAVGNVSSGWGAPTWLGLSNDGTKISGAWDSCGSRCNSVRSFRYIAIGNA